MEVASLVSCARRDEFLLFFMIAAGYAASSDPISTDSMPVGLWISQSCPVLQPCSYRKKPMPPYALSDNSKESALVRHTIVVSRHISFPFDSQAVRPWARVWMVVVMQCQQNLCKTVPDSHFWNKVVLFEPA